MKDKIIMTDYKGMSYKTLQEFADKMRVERNSYLVDLEMTNDKLNSYLKDYAGLSHRIEILETRIKELEDEIQKRK